MTSYKNPGWKKWLLIYLIIGVLVYVAIYYPALSPNTSLRYEQNTPKTNEKADTKMSAETKNWKEFSYDLFSIKVPPEFEEYQNTSDFIQFANYDPEKAERRGFNPELDGGKLKFGIGIIDTSKTLEEYVADLKQSEQRRNSEFIDDTVPWEETKITLGGQEAVRVKTMDSGSTVYALTPDKKNLISVSFFLDFDNFEALADQILQTFKFNE